MSPLDKITSGQTGGLAGFVERLSRRLGSGERTSDGVTRRGFFASTAVAGSALAVDPKTYALTPTAAYSTICGPGNVASNGWTVFCCTVNNGVNSCPPGSFAAGWWKAAKSSWCGGGYQYIVDCNAKCTGCTSGCSGDHICNTSCWNCSCGAGSSATCDQRRHCCNAFRYGQCNTDVSCSGGVNCRVLSCIPPYKWANCTTTSLVDDRTAEHGAPCLEGWGPIAVRYNAIGGNGSWLKASKGPERAVGDNRGRYVAYEGGWIYWTSGTGAHPLDPVAKAAWDAKGGPKGALGYPTGDRVNVTGGWSQAFEHGVLVDGPSTPLVSVEGTIYPRWVAAKREQGALGYPSANAVTSSAGTIQQFSGGVIADPAGAVPAVMVTGAIYSAWVTQGRENGALGWPQGEQKSVTGGIGQVFAGGEIWQRTGQSPVAVTGYIYAQWLKAGGASGSYGLPLGPPSVDADGVTTQRFTGGTITGLQPKAPRRHWPQDYRGS